MRCLLALILAICLASCADAKTRGAPLPDQISYNIVTNGGATCNGSGDDGPAFKAFNVWALANQGSARQVVLTIPNGSNCIFNSLQTGLPLSSSGINSFFAGINNLIVEGTGATLTQGSAGYWLGNTGICSAGLTQAGGCSARIQTASAGASTVTLTSASLAAGYVSRFPIGQWVMIGGLNTQAVWNGPGSSGDPPNLTYFEYRKVTAVNAGAGVITLDRPLSQGYLSTWPEYNNGDAFRPDSGGPATIYAVGGSSNLWNATLEYRGLTMYTTGNQLYAPTRNVTYRNVTFTGAGKGAIPTVNETWAAVNATWPADIEVDKLIGTITCDGCTIPFLDFQSNSTDLTIIRNSNITTNLVTGGKRTEITDTTINNLFVGSPGYGNSPGPVICTRCKVTIWQNNGVFQDDNPSPYAMSSGVISFANTAAAGFAPSQRWASTIGKDIFFATDGSSGQYASLGVFRVLGLTQDPTNVYVQTNQAGGFPTLTNFGTRIQFRANGAQQFTNDNPDPASDPVFIAMSVQNGATPLAPMMTYSKRSFTPSSATTLGSLYGIGKLVSLTIDVTVASTHTGSISLNPTAPFFYNTVKQSNWTAENFFPTINLKQFGKRVITPSGVTCDTGSGPSPGACAGDTITAPTEAVWMWGPIQPTTTGTFSGGVNPQFTMTIQTDQTP